MKITPVLTEKSLKEAKRGFYTFWIEKNLDKGEIKNLINKVYDVHVVSVRTINYKASVRKNLRGQKVRHAALKKAMVTLAEKEKIEVFEEKSK